jgi:[acyl-carrier-protein] S-malonyltransferase
VTIALLFPGQGTPRVHGALRGVLRCARGRALLERAAAAVDLPVARLAERPGLLDRTEIVQPVLTAISLYFAGELGAAGVVADAVLGHSLGELAAWSAAGAIDAEGAIALAGARGALMAAAAARAPGGLLALGTSDEAVIEAALAAGRREGAIAVAARNSVDETVLTGDEAALRGVTKLMAAGSVPVGRVPTSGPWHGPAMADAVAPLRRALDAAGQRPLRCRFISNRDGRVVEDASHLPGLLAEQLVRPVAFRAALATVLSLADTVVTVGPGALLRALFRRNTRGLGAAPRLLATDDAHALAEALAALGGPC